VNQHQLIKKTFSLDIDSLPSIEVIAKSIKFDGSEDYLGAIDTFKVRKEYIDYSFCILSHEFISEIINLLQKLEVNSIIELASGCGWLSHWIKKYKFENITAIDNMNWAKRDGWNVLDIVKKYDAVKFVKENQSIDLFILSWPYMDSMAYKIWKNMKESQYLLYIGEGEGGCTADDQFFEETFNNRVKCINLSDSFRSFWGIHDRPILFKK